MTKTIDQMKNCIRYVIIYFLILLVITSCHKHNEQIENLIINGSAELPRYDSTPSGWVNIEGHWRSVEGDSATHSYAYAQNGEYHFFEGQDLSGTLQQDINIDKYADGIDAHNQQFIFAGYVKSFLQNPPDQATITITGLDNSKSKQLYTFSSDTISSVNNWQKVTDTFIAPASTRFIRVQLIANRRNGADNDGYFDNIVLTAEPVESSMRFIFIAAFIGFLVIVFIVISKIKKGKKLPLAK
jgi:hypothetical protein